MDEEKIGDFVENKKERRRRRRGISSWDIDYPETFHGLTSVPSSTSGMIGSRRVVTLFFFFFFFPPLLEFLRFLAPLFERENSRRKKD